MLSELPAQAQIEHPGFLQLVPKQIFRISKEGNARAQHGLHTCAHIKPIAFIVNRDICTLIGSGDVSRKDSLPAGPLLEPIRFEVRHSS